MSRNERVSLHKKQERIQIGSGQPRVLDLIEGVPVIRDTSEGLMQYVRHKSVLYKQAYERIVDNQVRDLEKRISVSMASRPDYDSDWVNVTKDTEYPFVHNLSSKMFLQQWYFKDDSDNIFDLSSESLHEVYNSPTNKDVGISIFMEDKDQISVGTGAYFIFSHYKTDASATYVEAADGYLRCFLWNLDVSD